MKQLFLDLDGVFADFDGGFKLITGVFPWEVKKRDMWRAITRTPDFFAMLPQIEGSQKLWDVAKEYKPIFLTGAPPSNAYRQQKIDWVAEKFGPDYQVIVLPKKEKHIYSKPGTVLIDDTDWTIEAWFGKGGFAIYHQGDFDQTIATLVDYVTAGG